MGLGHKLNLWPAVLDPRGLRQTAGCHWLVRSTCHCLLLLHCCPRHFRSDRCCHLLASPGRQATKSHAPFPQPNNLPDSTHWNLKSLPTSGCLFRIC
ncbi:barrier-to-autointegration factor-like protein isoform X1 [Macaca thibetana thibetana]|uniref:barrier-to-autointegration factor-like protein isoform X1 n=1 Tax=Macaca thibetana thibetana TaxID=257877 RepID=UPI0021BC63E1|nr:barrier-to-autointegration factor-like protein isoform X1 [Macaca thibetana thibetana]